MSEGDVKNQLTRLLADHPDDFRIYSSGDAINTEHVMTHGPFENGDSQIITLVQEAIKYHKQVAIVAAGPTRVLLMTGKEGAKLFEGPPGTKQSAYSALITEGHAALLEGTQAKLNGDHATGKSKYKQALAAFKRAEEMRPNEASPKLGLAEASSHLWESEDPQEVMKKVEAAERLLREGLSEGKINKFEGKDVIQFEYAMCNLALKNRSAAKDNLRQVLVINPDHRLAGGILKTIEEEDSKRSGCFIATAAYGSPLAAEVQALRNFRDDVLRTSGIGRTFVFVYSALSPPLANFIETSESLKKLTRHVIIRPLLRYINSRSKR